MKTVALHDVMDDLSFLMRRLLLVLNVVVTCSTRTWSMTQETEANNVMNCGPDLDDPLRTDTLQSYQIGGTIRDVGGSPAVGIRVMLVGSNNVFSTQTDISGAYSFAGVGGNNYYTVAPCKVEFGQVVEGTLVPGQTVVAVAENEEGKTDGASPGLYHGHGANWCSEFVSWVYWQAGAPFVGGASDGGVCAEDWNMSTGERIVAGFGRNAQWQFLTTDEITAGWPAGGANPLLPQPGDFVLFSNTTGINASHSGLVRNIAGSTMNTVEGNVSE